jgi:hypothetical protein
MRFLYRSPSYPSFSYGFQLTLPARSLNPRFHLEVTMPGWWWNTLGLVLGVSVGMLLTSLA